MTTTGVSIRQLPNFHPETQEVYSVTVDGVKITTVVTKQSSTVEEWIDKTYNDNKEHLNSDNRGHSYLNWWRTDSDEDDTKKDRLKFLVVGFDVKWRPNVTDYDNNPVAVLTLCVDRRCLIFQIMRSERFLPWSLREFLQDENLRFVGVGIKDTACKLEDDYKRICVDKVVDLRDLAAESYGNKELKNLGLMELAKKYLFRGEVEKPDVGLSNWSQKFLTREQIMYACVDAYASFQIGKYCRPCPWDDESILALWDADSDSDSC